MLESDYKVTYGLHFKTLNIRNNLDVYLAVSHQGIAAYPIIYTCRPLFIRPIR